MPDVTFTRREYDAARKRWRLVRDICSGSEAVKSAGDYYLPRPNAQDESKENRKRFDAYLSRAQFYGATAHTKMALVGAAFRTWPTLTVPALLDHVATDLDGKGVSIYQQSQAVIGNLLEVGRHGLLVDYPSVDGARISLADQRAGLVQPTVTSYPTEAIINWKYRKVGGKQLLSLVVLRETVDEDTPDGFGTEEVVQYRVLRLGDDGIYTQEVWDEEKVITPVFAPVDSAGRPWRVIPFQFLGSENNDASIDGAPLYDMAEINLGHYRNSADYEEAAYLVGQPQPWLSGLDEQWRDHMEKQGLYLGSRAPWLLPVNGACGVWQAQPNTMAKEAMDAKERQMVAIGARLFEKGSAVKTATQDNNENAAEHSVLSLVVSNVSEAYEQCLTWCAAFAGATGEIAYKISQDFTQITLDPQVLAGLLASVQAGKMPEADFWQYLRDRGVIDPEKDDDAIREEIAQQDPGGGAAAALDEDDEELAA